MLHRRYKAMRDGETAWEGIEEENRETKEGSSRKGVKSTRTGDVDRDLNTQRQTTQSRGNDKELRSTVTTRRGGCECNMPNNLAHMCPGTKGKLGQTKMQRRWLTHSHLYNKFSIIESMTCPPCGLNNISNSSRLALK